MKYFFTALSVLMLFSSVGFSFECQRVLKDMKLVELDLLPQQTEGRSIASVDNSAASSKKTRIEKMKKFLAKAPIDKQRAFALIMVNYFIDESSGKPGNLLDGMDLINDSKKETKVIVIQPNDPNNEVLSYLTKTTDDDLKDVKGLIVYLLRAKNTHTEPAKVLAFLKNQVTKGNSHFSLLEKNCVAGDPTLEKIAAQ